MSESTRAEARHLGQGERELVGRTHHPQLEELSDEELARTRGLVRELRVRTRAIAHRQRREMRRKAEPAGARAASDDAGSRRKLSILAASVKRLGKEANRRHAEAARADLVANVGRALAMKRANARRHHPDPGRTAGRGMRPVESRRTEEIADPREAGRASQFVRAAQARRDHR